jgi:hypothetical protein
MLPTQKFFRFFGCTLLAGLLAAPAIANASADSFIDHPDSVLAGTQTRIHSTTRIQDKTRLHTSVVESAPIIIARGYGPGNGTGTGGSGPKNGTGYGARTGSCPYRS